MEEVSPQSGELRLDHTLDAGVFDHVHIRLSDAIRDFVHGCESLNLGLPVVRGSMEGMSDLVTHEHIVQTVRHVLPDGQGKNSLLQIEGCGLGRRIVDDLEILVRQETSENGLGFGVRVAHAYIIAQIRSKTTLRSVKPPILTDFLRIFPSDPINFRKIQFFPDFRLTIGNFYGIRVRGRTFLL